MPPIQKSRLIATYIRFSIGTYGSSQDDYEIEGNVAKALRKLQKQCLRTPADMVAILRLFGKNQVHSFEDYNSFDILGVFGRSCHL